MGNGTEGTDEGPRRPQAQVATPTHDELRRRFFYRAPRDEQAAADHHAVSHETFELACKLVVLCPPGRNLSLALTALEDVRMRANAAIAVDDPRP
jgi:hypothetical protein